MGLFFRPLLVITNAEGRTMTLKRLAEYNGYVWIICKTDDLARNFLKKSEKEGFTTPNGGNPTELKPYPRYGVTSDLSLGYVSATVAGLVKKHSLHITPTIDYEKFIKHRKCCIINNPYHEFEDFYKWNALTVPFMTDKERREFMNSCDRRDDSLSLQQYKAYIHRFLMLSSWHYSPADALERMTWDDNPEYIEESYERGLPVVNCALELGFGCG